MRPALALAAAAVLATAIAAEAREAPRTHATRLRADRAQPGVGRCTSDGACTFTREDGRTVRAAGVLGAPGEVRTVRPAKARRPVIPNA